jgi:predicted nucleic acid-binding protein
MIVLTTSVSEAMKPEPNPVVLIWLMTRRRKPLYISTVTLAELLFGIQALPQGRRWHLLDGTLNALLGLSRDRMLSFATEAVWCYAELAVAVRNGGVASRRWNGYIVAIAASRGFVA